MQSIVLLFATFKYDTSTVVGVQDYTLVMPQPTDHGNAKEEQHFQRSPRPLCSISSMDSSSSTNSRSSNSSVVGADTLEEDEHDSASMDSISLSSNSSNSTTISNNSFITHTLRWRRSTVTTSLEEQISHKTKGDQRPRGGAWGGHPYLRMTLGVDRTRRGGQYLPGKGAGKGPCTNEMTLRELAAPGMMTGEGRLVRSTRAGRKRVARAVADRTDGVAEGGLARKR